MITFADDPLIAAEHILAGGPATPADLIWLVGRLAGELDLAERRIGELEAELASVEAAEVR